MPLKVSHGIKSWIDDFQQSKDKRFDGKSAEKRREMAIAAYMAAKREQKENVRSADKKPQVFTKPDGKKGVRMVPVDREVVKQEKNLEWLKAALEAQARRAKPCDEDVEETSEAKIDELSMSLKDIKKTGLNKAASTNKEKLKKDLEAMKAKLNKEAKVDEVLDRPGALDSYRKKADASGNRARNSATRKILTQPKNGKRPDHSDELNTMRKRNKGQDMADRAANRHFRKSLGLGYNSKKEDVSEISIDKLSRYGKAAAQDVQRQRNKVKGALDQPLSTKHQKAGMAAMKKLTKRSKGSDMYVDKMTGRSKVKPSAATVGKDKHVSVENYAQKSADRHKNLMKQARSDMKNATSHSDMIKHMNKYQSAKKAHDRATRAQFDENKVDEISNAKMGQYVRKAADDAARKASKGDVVGARQRVKGVNKAMDKMDKNRLYGRQ